MGKTLKEKEDDVVFFKNGAYCSYVPYYNSFNHYHHIAMESVVNPNKHTPVGLMAAVMGLSSAVGDVSYQIQLAMMYDGYVVVEKTEPSPAGIALAEVLFDELTEKRRKDLIKTLGSVLLAVSSIAE